MSSNWLTREEKSQFSPFENLHRAMPTENTGLRSQYPLKFAILVTAPPLDKASDTAFYFLQAALKKGHIINQVFFYAEGVYHGNQLIYLENPDLIYRWQDLAAQYALKFVLCSASCARRGIMGKEQASYFEKKGCNLRENFEIASLSVWFAEMHIANRVMVFGEML